MLSGRFWCTDNGSKWNTNIYGEDIKIWWNATKDIPIGADLTSKYKNTDCLAYIFYLPACKTSSSTRNRMQQELWVHCFDHPEASHNSTWCINKNGQYKTYKTYIDAFRNSEWDYIIPTFKKGSGYKEEINGNYKYLGPFNIETVKTVCKLAKNKKDDDMVYDKHTFSGIKEITVETTNNSSFAIVDKDKNKISIDDINGKKTSFWIRIPKSDTCTKINCKVFAEELYIQNKTWRNI